MVENAAGDWEQEAALAAGGVGAVVAAAVALAESVFGFRNDVMRFAERTSGLGGEDRLTASATAGHGVVNSACVLVVGWVKTTSIDSIGSLPVSSFNTSASHDRAPFNPLY